MNQLTIINQGGQKGVDSREVAEMIGKPHNDLMKSIRNYCEYISNAGDFSLVDFFLESTYRDSKGETRPCYLLTKKGCDMVANKMTGEKGVLFTAAYVTAFEQMREHIATGKPLPKSRKSEQELAAADKRAKAMMLNAKTRVADRLQKLYDRAGVKPEYQALAISDFYAEDGINLPRIALQGTKVTYDKSTIAKRLGVLSKSGKPHAQAIGAIIRQLTLSPDEIERVPYARNGHDGTDEQYSESVIIKVDDWLSKHGYPNPVEIMGTCYNVRYAAARGENT